MLFLFGYIRRGSLDILIENNPALRRDLSVSGIVLKIEIQNRQSIRTDGFSLCGTAGFCSYADSADLLDFSIDGQRPADVAAKSQISFDSYVAVDVSEDLAVAFTLNIA